MKYYFEQYVHRSSNTLIHDLTPSSDASEFLLFADKSEGIIGLITLPPTDTTSPDNHVPTTMPSYQKHILARSAAPVAIGYDPVDGNVYWSDVKTKAIFRYLHSYSS